ncbi:hypothetical protein [Xenorhabdus anantnagensis]|uniref:Uncharacterized protein n=1 Tax=Xenorhabdus anantnagensis TaxID=3025875 RepID=A0ABT5LXJ0_9GAMM|nr:hypothetical protein [Xenorhabdus anantnagensis]MDC9598458.1 hypothetical protein [Xenorhabdus anantnagensis]
MQSKKYVGGRDKTEKCNSYHGRTFLVSRRDCFLQNVNKKIMSLQKKTHIRKQNGESGGNNKHTVNGNKSVKAGSILQATGGAKIQLILSSGKSH